MGDNVGFSFAVKEKQVQNEEEVPHINPAVSNAFVLIFLAVFFVGLGLFAGYMFWGNRSNNTENKTQGQTVPSDIKNLFSNDQTINSNTWTIYTDLNFTIKYPITWLLKKGYAGRDDILVYDPKSIKQVKQGGVDQRIPTVYLDIFSIENSSESAAQVAAYYAEQMKQKNTNIKIEESPKLKSDLVLFDNPGGYGKNVVLSQKGMQARFNTSAEHLTDNSVVNQILQNFEFTPSAQ